MHGEILGQSMSGKTWLAQYMGRKLSKDINVAVYSPHYFGGQQFKDEFGATFATNDETEIINHIWTHTNYVYFLDECTDKFQDTVPRKIMTQGRHLGHQMFLIGHRHTRLDKTMRDMCDLLLCFQVDIDDSKELSKAFIDENLRNAYELSKCNCRLSIKSEPESQHGINTRLKSDLIVVDSICRRLVLNAPGVNEELAKAIGIYEGNINYDFLRDKGYIY